MDEKKMSAGALPSTDTQEKESNRKVSHRLKKVKYCYINGKKYERDYVVHAVRTEFPKFDNTLLSKVLHPEYYGVSLIPEAIQTITGKKDTHRYTKRIAARLSDAAHALLTKHIEEKGYPSVNAWLVHLVMKYMEEEGLIFD